MNAAIIINAEFDAIERSTDLHALEAVYRKGARAGLEAALALRRIHKGELWKLTHSSWGSYCQYLGTTPQRAYQLIIWAKVSTEVDAHVPNERVAREIARLPDNAAMVNTMAELMEETGGKPTNEDARRIVDRKLAEVAPQLPGMPPAVVPTTLRKSTQDRRTPRWLFDALNAKFGPFLLDAYAAPHNAMCERFYTVEDDGNTREWADVTFANPEFKAMAPCLEQAVRQADLGFRSIILGPVGCSQEWHHKWAIRGTLFYPDCRINYDDPAGNPTGSGLDEGGADRDTIIMGFGRELANEPGHVAAGWFRAQRLEVKGCRP